MSERTQLQNAAALLALHTDAELDALRETYHKQDLRREAERCVNWWNNTKGGRGTLEADIQELAEEGCEVLRLWNL